MISFERKALERLEKSYEEALKKRQEIDSGIKTFTNIIICLFLVRFAMLKYSQKDTPDSDGHVILELLITIIVVLFAERVMKFYRNRFNKQTFLPLRARDYLNQKFIFCEAIMSNEPFVLVLRSFEQSRYFQKKSVFDNKTYFKQETDYEDIDHNVYERIEACLNFPVKLIYVGGTKNCCTINCLQKSLFLIADENWFSTVEILIKKSMFIVLMPGNSTGLLRELKHIAQIYSSKSYLFMPKRFDKDPRMLKRWINTYDEFVKAGINMPYESPSKNDSFYKMSDDIMNEIDITSVYNFHKVKDYNSIKESMSELVKSNYINSDYLRECLKYYKVNHVINQCGIRDVFFD